MFSRLLRNDVRRDFRLRYLLRRLVGRHIERLVAYIDMTHLKFLAIIVLAAALWSLIIGLLWGALA